MTSRNNGANWLVTTADKSVMSVLQNGELSVLKLPDPACGLDRCYMTCQTTTSQRKHFFELQALPPDEEPYNAFFLKGPQKNYVVGDPLLYLVTAMDPLFFCLLDTMVQAEDRKLQWQPIDQILPAFPPIAQEYLTDPVLADKIFDKLKISEDDPEQDAVYRFSVPKTLQWLKNKQERVCNILVYQELQEIRIQEELAKSSSSPSSTASAAFSANFNLGGSSPAAQQTEAMEQRSRQRKEQQRITARERARRESIQVVCSYLSEKWRTLFLDHLQAGGDILLTAAELREKRKRVEQASAGEEENRQPEKTKPKKETEPPRTVSVGLKRLAKVNTKGMAKMSSFFQVKKKAKEQ